MAEGLRHGFAEWWSEHRVSEVRNPRGFAQMVWAAAVSCALRRVTVTTDEAGKAVAVALTNDDGQYVRVLWEAPATCRLLPAATMNGSIAERAEAGLDAGWWDAGRTK